MKNETIGGFQNQLVDHEPQPVEDRPVNAEREDYHRRYGSTEGMQTTAVGMYSHAEGNRIREDRPERQLFEAEASAPLDNNPREVNIKPLSSGYVVTVGCQTVAVESTGKLIGMLSQYLADPNGFEKKWNSKSVRNRLDNI